MIARARKAVVAGVTTALGVAVAGLVGFAQAGDLSSQAIAAYIGAAVAAGVVAGWATFRTPNVLSTSDLRGQGVALPGDRRP